MNKQIKKALTTFHNFFFEVHGFPPFPWQERTLEHVLTHGVPDSISTPTAAGKTCIYTILVFALSEQVDLPSRQRSVGRRIFGISDRRILVDEGDLHSKKLVEALQAAKTPVVKQVAENLLKYGGKVPLASSVMRGGILRDNTWAEDPLQPSICMTTVDQIGSQLLFRGYGISRYQCPINAGLIATDSTLVVDEAQLSQPFIETLISISTFREVSDKRDDYRTPFNTIQMSATLPNEPVLQLTEEDYNHAVLGPRLLARKICRFDTAPDDQFVNVASDHAIALSQPENVTLVGVIVNTVATARAIHQKLFSAKHEAILLIGRTRPHNRDILLQEKSYGERIQANSRSRVEGGRTLFVVSTQTLEAGVNVDFDALVTECAPLSSLQQRFGRLNRLGKLAESQAVIVLKKAKQDFIYGDIPKSVFTWLGKQATGKGKK